ncbi:MAG: hypothetical protein ACE5OZ_18455 [Candidatus Heimdallarchaeota archaeon]
MSQIYISEIEEKKRQLYRKKKGLARSWLVFISLCISAPILFLVVISALDPSNIALSVLLSIIFLFGVWKFAISEIKKRYGELQKYKEFGSLPFLQEVILSILPEKEEKAIAFATTYFEWNNLKDRVKLDGSPDEAQTQALIDLEKRFI